MVLSKCFTIAPIYLLLFQLSFIFLLELCILVQSFLFCIALFHTLKKVKKRLAVASKSEKSNNSRAINIKRAKKTINKQTTDTKNEAKRIQSNNFSWSNRERPNIIITISKKDNWIIPNLFWILGAPIIFCRLYNILAYLQIFE